MKQLGMPEIFVNCFLFNIFLSGQIKETPPNFIAMFKHVKVSGLFILLCTQL